MEPTPIRPDAPRRPRIEPLFLLGVAIGAIPIVIWLVILGIALGGQGTPASDPYANLNFLLTGLMWTGVVYLVMWIVAIVLMASGRAWLDWG